MKKYITQRLVESLRNARPEKKYDISDEALPGFGITVSPTGRHSYRVYCRWPPNYRPSRRTIGPVATMRLSDAREKASEWLWQIATGRDPIEEERKAKGSLFGNVAEDFIKIGLRNKRRAYRDALEIRRMLIPALGGRSIKTINRRQLITVIENISVEHPASAHLALSHLKRIYSFAIDRDYGVDSSPAASIKPQRVIGGKHIRERTLSDDELRQFVRACSVLGYPHGSFLMLVLYTAARNNEARRARWAEFHLGTQPVWTIPSERYKSEQEHRIPLTTDAVELLMSLPRWSGGDYVFSFSKGRSPMESEERGMKKLREIMGTPTTFTIHDLRRTVRTRLAALRVPDVVAEMILGHGRRGIQRTYDQHTYQAEMAEALELWSSSLRQLAV